MKPLQRKLLQQIIDGLAEPVLVTRIDSADWPVVMHNPAFAHIAGDDDVCGRPFADIIESLLGRDLALDVGEALRQEDETSFAVEITRREYLLVLKPLSLQNNPGSKFYAAYWRSSPTGHDAFAQGDVHQALVKAKRRIRDLSRDDPVTGLLNEAAFRDVLAHDWAVAAREQTRLALVAFSLDDFDEYRNLFGGHAADSCQRRVAQAIKRFLRRASDVAAHITAPHGDFLLVLSHASEEQGVRQFAERISKAVRELGLHHPRSKSSRFVTVSFNIAVRPAGGEGTAKEFLAAVLDFDGAD
ncbi:MAG: GGDEF domain-containing protein [Gammaproteobacteria bacterium]|nr:GGDEF domain-containing protein [Gammaproteobacteria bacterium]